MVIETAQTSNSYEWFAMLFYARFSAGKHRRVFDNQSLLTHQPKLMKRNPLPLLQGFAAAALLLGAASLSIAQTTNFYVNGFTSAGNTPDTTPAGCGVWYGGSTILWDPSTVDTLGGPGDDACYININLSEGDQSCAEDYICPNVDGENLWYTAPGVGVLLSNYKAIHFDVLWDTANSVVGIDQFNNLSDWPASLLQSWASTNYLASSDPNTNGLEVDVAGMGAGNNAEPAFLGYVNIPDAASNGWVTVTLPINPSLPNIDQDSAGAYVNGACGILFKKWVSQPWGENAGNNVFFWVGNVWFEGSAAPPPPPSLQLPAKPTPGLNVFASTPGINDRQQAGLVASNGVSWVGHATTSNPVTYSFTINGFPQNPATQYACEAYMMLSPNPTYYDEALDWNETNCLIVWLQQGAGSTLMSFTSKVNDPGGNSADQLIGTVTNIGTAMGKWSVTFTSDTNVTMTAPNGNTSSFVFTNAPYFAETTNPGCFLYLGMQPNNTAGQNDAVCYSQFSLSGAPAAVTDNFLTDTTLNTNVWYNFMATGSAGVFVMPTNAEYWLTWNIPAAGFHLQTASSISGPWTLLNNDKIIPGAGAVYQLVTTNDVPTGSSAAFFDLANP
jgi:hypothetical protein